MKTTTRLLLSICIAPAFLLCGAASSHGAVVTYIDLFNTSQFLSTNNTTIASTVASAGALGGFRTITLSTLGGDPPEVPPNTGASVSSGTQRFTLSTPTEAVSSFEIKWGGAGGTAGLGGVDLRGGLVATNFSLTSSTLNFSLRSADQPSSFVWTFTDTSSNVATYNGSFPSHSSTNPAIPYAISLASLSGSGLVDWSSINFITLSGGGLELDLSIPAALSVTARPIPEPGTWAAAALLLGATVYTMWRRRQNATAQPVAVA